MLIDEDRNLVQCIIRGESPPAQLIELLSSNATSAPKTARANAVSVAGRAAQGRKRFPSPSSSPEIKTNELPAARLLSLATAVARAAHANPGPLTLPAWRASVLALRSLSSKSILTVAKQRGKADAENIPISANVCETKSGTVAAVETYAALYALEVMESSSSSSLQKREALLFASEALRAVFQSATPGSTVSQLCSILPRDANPDTPKMDKLPWSPQLLDEILFPGARSLQMLQLLPSFEQHAGTTGNVVVSCLIARLYDCSCTIHDRLLIARTLIVPWAKHMNSWDRSRQNAKVYFRKTRTALNQAAKEEHISDSDALQARIYAAGLIFEPCDYAKTVLKAGLVFLRGRKASGKAENEDTAVIDDYRLLAALYEGAVMDFSRKCNGTTTRNIQAQLHEDVCAWFDHVYLVFERIGDAHYHDIAVSLSKQRRDLLEKSYLALPTRLQAFLIHDGLYSRYPPSRSAEVVTAGQKQPVPSRRDISNYPANILRSAVARIDELVQSTTSDAPIKRAQDIVKGAQEDFNENALRIEPQSEVFNQTSLGLIRIRILRVLEPLRRVLCNNVSFEDIQEDVWCPKSRFLWIYVCVLISGIVQNQHDATIHSRFRAMAGAALSTCEVLLKLCACKSLTCFIPLGHCFADGANNSTTCGGQGHDNIENHSQVSSLTHSQSVREDIAETPDPDDWTGRIVRRLVNASSNIVRALIVESSDSQRKQSMQWATWLSVMFNNIGIEFYNRSIRDKTKESPSLFRSGGLLMEKSAEWLASAISSQSIPLQVDSKITPPASPCCVPIAAPHASKYVRRLASASDAYLAENARVSSSFTVEPSAASTGLTPLKMSTYEVLRDSLRTTCRGLHTCYVSNIIVPVENVNSFARSIISSIDLTEKSTLAVDELYRHSGDACDHYWFSLVVDTIHEYYLNWHRESVGADPNSASHSAREETILKALSAVVKLALGTKNDQVAASPCCALHADGTERKSAQTVSVTFERYSVYELWYLDARLDMILDKQDSLSLAMKLQKQYSFCNFADTDKQMQSFVDRSPRSRSRTNSNRMSTRSSDRWKERSVQSTPEPHRGCKCHLYFQALSSAWLAVEGLDSSKIPLAIDDLQTNAQQLPALDQTSDKAQPPNWVASECNVFADVNRNKRRSFLWFQLLEIAKWIAFTLAQHDMDAMALHAFHLARMAAAQLNIPFNESEPAEICRRLGYAEQCRMLICPEEASDAYAESKTRHHARQCAGVHGRLLNDLGKYEHAACILKMRDNPVCCVARAEALLFGHGKLEIALEDTKRSLKLLLSSLTTQGSVLLRNDQMSGTHEISLSGLVFSMKCEVHREYGRSRHAELVELVRCLCRLADLYFRIDLVLDARYYASKAVAISSKLFAPGLRSLTKAYFESLPNPSESHISFENENLVSHIGSEYNPDDALVNSLTTARILMTLGDAESKILINEYDENGESCAAALRAVRRYEEANSKLDIAAMTNAVSSDLLNAMKAYVLNRKGDALLRTCEAYAKTINFLPVAEYLTNSARGQERVQGFDREDVVADSRRIFDHVRNVINIPIEERMIALTGLSEALLSQNLAREARDVLAVGNDNIGLIEQSAPRISKQYYLIQAGTEVALGTDGNNVSATESLIKAHGSSFAMRQKLAKNYRSDDDDDLSRQFGSLSLQPTALNVIRDSLTKKSCVLVGLTLSKDKSNLFLWRVCPSSLGENAASVISLPMPTTGDMSIDNVLARLNSVLACMKDMSVGGLELSAEEKAAWWKKRFELDHRIGQIMAEIEATWLGPARAILLPVTLSDMPAKRTRMGKLLPSASHCARVFGVAMKHFPSLISISDLHSFVDPQHKDFPEVVDKIARELKVAESASRASCQPLPGTRHAEDQKTNSGVRTRRQMAEQRESLLSQRDRPSRCSTSASCDESIFARVGARSFANSESATRLLELYLAVDTELEQLPWECLPILRSAKCGITRMPHISYLTKSCLVESVRHAGDSLKQLQNSSSTIHTDPGSVYYMLNPSGDLETTQKTFQESFESQQEWRGISGLIETSSSSHPTRIHHSSSVSLQSHISNLEQSDIYLYLGHGAGEEYISSRELAHAKKLPVSVLMGCSSGSLKRYGGFIESSGTITDYLIAGAPAVVANLWDVSDRDIDRLTGALMARWLHVGPVLDAVDDSTDEETRGTSMEESSNLGLNIGRQTLSVALANARNACRLPYLVGAATVIYGHCCVR